jgi:NitT/TauT family transport system ATP-binding protein
MKLPWKSKGKAAGVEKPASAAEDVSAQSPASSNEPVTAHASASSPAQEVDLAASATVAPIAVEVPHVVEFRNVAKVWNPGTHRAFTALENLTFTVPDLPGRGEIRAILGPSGCGKSTALNMLCGFHEFGGPTTGEILVRGVPVHGPGIDRGMVFQKYSSFPHLSVVKNVRFGLELNREELGIDETELDRRAREWIDRVGLTPHIHKFPHQLSGGQQQRVALARTMVLKPRILLMDEPFSALDEPTRLEMQRLLVDLWAEVEATILMVTHSIIEAVYLGDTVWIYSAAPGRIAATFPDLPIAPPGVHPLEVQRDPGFLKRVEEVSASFRDVESQGRKSAVTAKA